MAKAIAYLVLLLGAVLLLNSVGLFDGMFNRGNLKERAKFWEDVVARETPPGSSKTTVDALIARYGMTLECFHTSVTPPVVDCMANDPNSKGGMPAHPAVLELRFTFRSEKLEKFETNSHYLK